MYVWTEYYKNELIVHPLPLVQDGLFEIVERLLSDYNIINDEHSSDNESLSEIKQFCNDFMADYKGYTQKLFNYFKLHPTIIDLKYQSDKFPKYIKKSFELEKIRTKQDMPFDLFTDVFLKNREEIIAYKMQQILENDAEKILEENYNLAKKQSFKNNNRIFRMLERDIDRFKIEDLKLIFKYYNIEDIVRVLLFYMNNIAQNRSGFPDLMIFNENGLKFIEVKGPNDTIKEHQIEKIMLLNQNNIKSEILTINHTERKLNNLTKK